MTLQQIELFAIFAAVLALLLSGRVRHDLVAVGGLMFAVVLGLIPESRAFSGFSNPAVMIVALVLVASRAFENSGALALISRGLVKQERPLAVHIAVIGSVGAALSTIINNVAALALLMPVDIQSARRAGRSPRLSLMPLAFATVLGGMVTLIGTPTNIVASTFRARELGAPYQMFDFAPVGLAVALAGLAFIALFGWRLIGKDDKKSASPVEAEEFIADLVVPEGAAAIGKLFAELDEAAQQADVVVVGVLRDGRRLTRKRRYTKIAPGDLLTIEGPSDGVASFIKALGLQQRDDAKRPAQDPDAADDAEESAGSDHVAIVQAVVRSDARIVGRSAERFQLRSRFGVSLLGVAHQGETIRERVSSRIIDAGDVLLLTGPPANIRHVVQWLGAMPIDFASVTPTRLWRILLTLGCFAGAILAASFGWLSFPIGMAIAVAIYAAVGLVPAREFYDQIEWSIVVMLACLLPLGEAFETVGGANLVADLILHVGQGQSAVLSLVLLMIAVMALSAVLNNVATMVVAGPLALAMAGKLGVNPDSFLMGAAVATSCSFLTPIGHKNNTLVMGPGGYSFSDYWRMGLPLEIIMLVVGVPAILLAWPL